MATFWEIAAHSVDHMFSKDVDVILVIDRFGFEGWIWVLIASFTDLCILFTSNKSVSKQKPLLSTYTYRTNGLSVTRI